MTLQNERIAKRIKDLELSYSEVAEASKMQKSTVYRYATGERENIPVSAIEALAPVLKTSAAYLMGWCDDPDQKFKPTTVSGDELDEDVIRVAEKFNRLSPEDQQKVEEYMTLLSMKDRQ